MPRLKGSVVKGKELTINQLLLAGLQLAPEKHFTKLSDIPVNMGPISLHSKVGALGFRIVKILALEPIS
jgi:hypothetical protein